jgi:hypothetical protein
LRQVLCGGWLVRVSGSTRRTANSATPLPGHAGSGGLIDAIEAIYRRCGQPAIFRIPSYLEPGFDRQLAERGYPGEGHSFVIHGAIDAVAAAADPDGVGLLSAPGRALYRGVGMTTELHRYHYRRK